MAFFAQTKYHVGTKEGSTTEGVPIARNAKAGKKAVKTPRKTAPKGSGDRTLLLVLGGFTALVVIAMAVFAYLNTPGARQGSAGEEQGLLPVGAKAPGFSAETVTGEEVSLANKGEKRATMLVFFATWCPGCKEEAPVLADLARGHEDLRIIMVGIDGRDDPGKVRGFVERYGIEAPAVYQPSLGSTYKVSGYPTTYLLNGDEEVVFARSGKIPGEVLESKIDAALG